jgi:hypothetical protein
MTSYQGLDRLHRLSTQKAEPESNWISLSCSNKLFEVDKQTNVIEFKMINIWRH